MQRTGASLFRFAERLSPPRKKGIRFRGFRPVRSPRQRGGLAGAPLCRGLRGVFPRSRGEDWVRGQAPTPQPRISPRPSPDSKNNQPEGRLIANSIYIKHLARGSCQGFWENRRKLIVFREMWKRGAAETTWKTKSVSETKEKGRGEKPCDLSSPFPKWPARWRLEPHYLNPLSRLSTTLFSLHTGRVADSIGESCIRGFLPSILSQAEEGVCPSFPFVAFTPKRYLPETAPKEA